MDPNELRSSGHLISPELISLIRHIRSQLISSVTMESCLYLGCCRTNLRIQAAGVIRSPRARDSIRHRYCLIVHWVSTSISRLTRQSLMIWMRPKHNEKLFIRNILLQLQTDLTFYLRIFPQPASEKLFGTHNTMKLTF